MKDFNVKLEISEAELLNLIHGSYLLFERLLNEREPFKQLIKEQLSLLNSLEELSGYDLRSGEGWKVQSHADIRRRADDFLGVSNDETL